MKFIKNGSVLSIADVEETYESMPKGVWLLKRNLSGFFFQEKENFSLPSKIYGDHSIISRWKKSWEHNSSKNMGILLSGIKGSGKTITAQKFCNEMDVPVIIINEAFVGTEFIDFLSNKEIGEAIVFIDEFEKIYSEQDQNDILSLMDGLYQTRLIFLLTINKFNINEYLINRLGRIKYRKHYDSLDSSVVSEVIDDMLVNKQYKESIYDFFDQLGTTTYDILVNMIKEINLFDQDALECAKHLNLKREPRFYNIKEIYEGIEYECHGHIVSSFTEDFEFEIRRTMSGKEAVDKIYIFRREYNDNLNAMDIPEEEKEKSFKELPWNGWELYLDSSNCNIIKNNDKSYTLINDNYPNHSFIFTPSYIKTNLAF